MVTFCLGVEWGTGLFTTFAEGDVTGICVLIWFIGIGAAAWAGLVSLQDNPHMKRVKFLSQLCQLLGLLGTVMGMITGLDLESLATIDVEDKAAIVETMVNIATSVSTCLTTTATGLIFSVMISLYPFVIKDYSDE